MSATPAAEQLIHDEAVREVAHQRATTSELHVRASLLIAAAAIAISLLGDGTDEHGAATGCAAIALFGFLLVCISALAMIWPRRDMPMMLSAVRLLTQTATARAPLDERTVRRHLLKQLEVQQWLTARRNSVLSRVFRVGGVGLILQLAATVAIRFLTI